MAKTKGKKSTGKKGGKKKRTAGRKVGSKRKGHVFGSGMKAKRRKGRGKLKKLENKSFKRLTPSYLNWG